MSAAARKSLFDEVGEEFEALEAKEVCIAADGTDAWFAPAPSVLAKVAGHLSFAIRTAPPSHCHGLTRAIARARGVAEISIVGGADWSRLAVAGLGRLVTAASRVLVLDPLDGEYLRILETILGARLIHFGTSRIDGYRVDLDRLASASRGCDLVVLANPNPQTGHLIAARRLEDLFRTTPRTTRWWVDETLVDYAGSDESLERCAAASPNVIVCKSMSAAYALSGVGVAYLCGPPAVMAEVGRLWRPAISLPGQIAACEALHATDYYRARWADTCQLRRELAAGLSGLGCEVVPGCVNVVLCHLSETQPAAHILVRRLRDRRLFIADAAGIGGYEGSRRVRIAVMDRDTNLVILEMLREALSSRQSNFSLSSALPHDL